MRQFNCSYYIPEIPEPKYWNEKTKKVVVDNVEIAKKPITLDSILGTYRWFYFQYDGRDGDIEPNSGYITLESNSKSKTTPAKVFGSLQLHVHDGTFQGLRKAEQKESKRVGNQRYRKNFWEIKKMNWEGDGDMGDEGGFGVCEVEDDNGNPFLKLEWGDEEFHGCHGPSDFSLYVGKKVSSRNASDEECGLTEDEQIRLGMVLSVKEVEELATKGYISDGGSDEEEEISESKDVKKVIKEVKKEEVKKEDVKMEDVKKEDVKEDVKGEDIKDGVKEEKEAAHLKRRLSTDEKEEIDSSEPKKKVHKAF